MIRLIKFSTVGASGAVLALTTQIIVVEVIGWHYIAGYAIGYILAVSNNYLWNSLWTFKEKESHLTGLGKYSVTSLVTFIPRVLIVIFLTDVVSLFYWISTIVVIGLGSIANFGLSKRFVWNKLKQQSPT